MIFTLYHVHGSIMQSMNVYKLHLEGDIAWPALLFLAWDFINFNYSIFLLIEIKWEISY